MLSSPNKNVKSLCIRGLQHEVKLWLRREVNKDDLSRFLSGISTGEFNSYITSCGGGPKNKYKHGRKSTSRLNKKFHVSWQFDNNLNPSLHISFNELRSTITFQTRTMVYRTLRKFLSLTYANDLLQHKSQGKPFSSIQKDKSSIKFLSDGHYISQSAFNFIHRARLNLLKCNGNKLTCGSNLSHPECRRCQYPMETLPHILNHCHRNMGKHIINRHNCVQNELVDEIKKKLNTLDTIAVNQECNVANRHVRPDIVVMKNNKIWIIDVAICYESDEGAFERARFAKIQRYLPEVQEFEKRGYIVAVDAFVVGSLGSYDVANNYILRDLMVPNSNQWSLKRRIVRDVINHSKNVYYSHVLGAKFILNNQNK